MCTEIVSSECSDFNLLDYAAWAQENQLWDGRHYSADCASEYQKEVEEKIHMLFSSAQNNDQVFNDLGALFSWVGRTDQNQSLLARDIQALKFDSENLIIPAGMGKSISNFWKKHKKEILIGIGVLVVITVVVVIAVCASAAAATAAGAAGIASLKSIDQNSPSSSDQTFTSPLLDRQPDKISFESVRNNIVDEGEKIDKQIDFKKVGFFELLGEKTVNSGNKNYSLDEFYSGCEYPTHQQQIEDPFDPSLPGPKNVSPDCMQPLYPTGTNGIGMNKYEHSVDYHENEVIPNKVIAGPTMPPPEKPKPQYRIFGINGIGTSLDEALGHGDYLSDSIVNGECIWVYNKTNDIDFDILETLVFNYGGISINTAAELKDNWTKFHELNLKNPKLKCLQFCHSQGALHVKNALRGCPQEIRDRVIVVAIAPASVIPKDLCYESYNYVSSRDAVPYGELIYDAIFKPHHFGLSLKHLKELILLPAHPDESLFDHGIRSKTFRETIEGHISGFEKARGEY